jgi:hypothetical protein
MVFIGLRVARNSKVLLASHLKLINWALRIAFNFLLEDENTSKLCNHSFPFFSIFEF